MEGGRKGGRKERESGDEKEVSEWTKLLRKNIQNNKSFKTILYPF